MIKILEKFENQRNKIIKKLQLNTYTNLIVNIPPKVVLSDEKMGEGRLYFLF